MRKYDLWRLTGSIWTAWWLFIVLWITWYDYPRDVDIYRGFLGDASWYWHEIAIPIGIWLFGMVALMLIQIGHYVYHVSMILGEFMKRIEKGGV